MFGQNFAPIPRLYSVKNICIKNNRIVIFFAVIIDNIFNGIIAVNRLTGGIFCPSVLALKFSLAFRYPSSSISLILSSVSISSISALISGLALPVAKALIAFFISSTILPI